MIQLTDKHWAFALPEGAHHVGVRGRVLYCCLPGMSVPITGSRFQLPPGSWQFLFTTKEATEEELRQELPAIVDKDFVYFHEYMFAFNDLLKSKGCDITKNYAIIEKI